MSLYFVAKRGDDLVPHTHIADELAGVAVIDSESVGEGSGDTSPHPLGGEQTLGAVESEDYGNADFFLLKWPVSRYPNLVADSTDFSKVA